MLLRLLSKQAVERRGLFSWPAIEETMALHFASREDHTDHLLALLNLEIWAQIYLDGRAPADLAAELTEEVSAVGWEFSSSAIAFPTRPRAAARPARSTCSGTTSEDRREGKRGVRNFKSRC